MEDICLEELFYQDTRLEMVIEATLKRSSKVKFVRVEFHFHISFHILLLNMHAKLCF